MKLDDNFHIEGNAGNIQLIQKVPCMKLTDPKNKKSEKSPSIRDDISFYGTVYQALQGYLKKSIDITVTDGKNDEGTIKDIRKTAIKVLNNLDSLEAEIKEKFCIYVKTTKG